FAIALQNLVWGLAMPVAGASADRFGGARVLIAGGLAYGLGRWAMAYSTHPLAFDLAAGLLVGLGLACTGFGVVLAVVARAFPPERRSVAVGIAGACGSFGQFVMLPWGQALISRFGWLNALLVLGACAFVMIPLGTALAGRNRAGDESDQSIGAALAEAIAHRGFWLLTASFFVCGFQTIFVMTHLPAYLVDRGLSPAEGMAALATIGLFNIAGSYFAGALGARYSRKRLLAWIYAVRALVIALFISTPVSAAGAYLFAALLGVMVAGVSHEVADPLAAIHSMLQILQSKRAVPPETLEKGLASIGSNIARVLAITKRLGDFSRVGSDPPGPVAMDAAVEEAIS